MFSQKVIRRGFSSAANTARSSFVSAVEEKVSCLPNRLTVASVDLCGAVSQLLIAFKAGTRYEQPNEVGLVHHLRNSIGTDSVNYLGVKLLWQSGSIGSNIVSSASKDLFIVQMSVNRTFANVGLSLLGELSQPAFKPWDTVDSYATLQSDLSLQQAYDIVIEALHKAAYRNGPLANTLLSPAERIGKIKFKQLSAFAKSRFVSSQAAIVGVNVDHSVLLSYANSQSTIVEGTGQNTQPSPYYGGDARIYGDTSLAHVAIAGQGAKLSNEKSVAVFALLSYIIGRGSNLKFGNINGFGTVAQAVYKTANHNVVAVNAINVIHADSGLAGVYIVGDGDKIHSYVKAAIQGLKSLALSEIDAETLAIAKKFVQVDSNVNASSSSNVAIDRATQLLLGSATSTTDFLKSVEAVTVDDVKKAAGQLVSKISVAAYGKTNQVPYADQL